MGTVGSELTSASVRATSYGRSVAERVDAWRELAVRTLIVWIAVSAAVLVENSTRPRSTAEVDSFALGLAFAIPFIMALGAVVIAFTTARMRRSVSTLRTMPRTWAKSPFHAIAEAWVLIGFGAMGMAVLIVSLWPAGLIPVLVALLMGPNRARLLAATQVATAGIALIGFQAGFMLDPLELALRLVPLLPLLFLAGLLGPPWPSARQTFRTAYPPSPYVPHDKASAGGPSMYFEKRRFGQRPMFWTGVGILMALSVLNTLFVAGRPRQSPLPFWLEVALGFAFMAVILAVLATRRVMETTLAGGRLVVDISWGGPGLDLSVEHVRQVRVTDATGLDHAPRRVINPWSPAPRRLHFWGSRVVEVTMSDGSRVFIGSQDPDGLASALRASRSPDSDAAGRPATA